jgi:hypothetical protein
MARGLQCQAILPYSVPYPLSNNSPGAYVEWYSVAGRYLRTQTPSSVVYSVLVVATMLLRTLQGSTSTPKPRIHIHTSVSYVSFFETKPFRCFYRLPAISLPARSITQPCRRDITTFLQFVFAFATAFMATGL